MESARRELLAGAAFALSVSRLARNTEDCLHYVRKLKEKGIAVYFETENIDTLGSTGELLLTILSGLAQDSSRNQSDVTRWGIQRQFESGRVLVNTTRFLGYDKNENGELIINEKEAEVVRRIYADYLEGKGLNAIGLGLTKDGIKNAEQAFGIENLSDPENMTISHHINQELRSHGIMKRDKDYVVQDDGDVVIVDEFTGRLMYGRRYSDGRYERRRQYD
jgi:DNA invertase Pin-like site-specific DNA recombinase